MLRRQGLDPTHDRVVSVAAFRVNFAGLKETKDELNGSIESYLVNPQCPISSDAQAVHGITDADVEGKPAFASIAQELREFIGDARLVGHNVQFDKKFLNSEFKRAKVKTLARNKSFCTMRRFAMWDDGKPYTRLDDVAKFLGISGRTNRHHDAKEDAIITAKVAGIFWLADSSNQGGTSMTKTTLLSIISPLRIGLVVLCLAAVGCGDDGGVLVRPEDDVKAWETAKEFRVVWLNPHNEGLEVDGLEPPGKAIPWGTLLRTEGPEEPDSPWPICFASMVVGEPPYADRVVRYHEFSGPATYLIPADGHVPEESSHVWEFSSLGCMPWEVQTGDAELTPTSTPLPSPTPAPAIPTPTPGPSTYFSDGHHLVGQDIAPGTYNSDGS